MDANRREVDKLLSDKWKIEKKLKQIQTECKHSKQVIKQVADESSFTLRHVCESCGKSLGYPSSKEIQNYLEK